jgi:hypothetical protein
MNSDVVNYICNYLHTKDIKALKLTCKDYNRWIKLVKIHVFHCVCNEKGIPIEGNNNLHVQIEQRKSQIQKVFGEIADSTVYNILAITLYSQLFRGMEDTIFDDTPSYQQPRLTNYYVEEKISYNIDVYGVFYKIKNVPKRKKIVKYIEKEIRLTLRKAWLSEHWQYVKVECVFDMLCLLSVGDGILKEKTIGAFRNLIKFFNLE